MTVQTCPAARKPCTRFPGAPRIASIAGGTSTCETRIEKLGSPKLPRLPHRHRVAGRGGLETDREEDHLAVGMLLRQLDRIER